MPKKRCFWKDCKKKLKITDMKCKCQHRFCSKHRLPETHQCTWDPKSEKEIEIYKQKAGLNVNSTFKKIDVI